MSNISNNFDNIGHSISSRGLRRGKDIVERHRAISVFDLKKQGVFEYHALDTYPCFSRGIHLQWVRDQRAHDCYIELVKRGPNNTQSTFSLVTTRPHFGGKRQWFLCPTCDQRTAILYEHNDDFHCRKCLNLAYYSQKMSYSTIEPIIRNWKKLEELEPPLRYIHYRGRATKRTQRYDRLRAKTSMGMAFAEARYAKK